MEANLIQRKLSTKKHESIIGNYVAANGLVAFRIQKFPNNSKTVENAFFLEKILC